MSDGGDHVLVSHAEFVARCHRRLRVIGEFQRLADDHANESDCRTHPHDPDLGAREFTSRRLRTQRRVPVPFPQPR